MELAFCLYKHFPLGGLQREFLLTVGVPGSVQWNRA